MIIYPLYKNFNTSKLVFEDQFKKHEKLSVYGRHLLTWFWVIFTFLVKLRLSEKPTSHCYWIKRFNKNLGYHVFLLSQHRRKTKKTRMYFGGLGGGGCVCVSETTNDFEHTFNLSTECTNFSTKRRSPVFVWKFSN